MTSANSAYITRDLAHVWHPCTQMKDHEHELPLNPIRRSEGVYVIEPEEIDLMVEVAREGIEAATCE